MAEELTAAVRAALADEVADVTAAPDLLAAVRRRYRRRVLARRVVFATPVVAAVVVGVVVAAPAPPADRAGTPTTSAVPEPVNVANIRQQMTAALADVANHISYERATITGDEKYGDPGRSALYERWQPADGSSFRLLVSRDGVPLNDLSYDRVAYVDVDYRTRTYVAREGVEMNTGTWNEVWTPREIQQELAAGVITVVGTEQVAGRATLELRVSERKGDVPVFLWVDQTSYLPVRWQYDQDGATPFDITWLPPTPENEARLTAPIPDDFERRDSY